MTVLTAVILGQDSTGQRITFIVIGLLLAALALAILTAWYYRVTDPGPKRSRVAQGSDELPGGGSATDPHPDPDSGPGWRKRLSGFDVPDTDATVQNADAKRQGATNQEAKALAKQAKAAQKAKKTEAREQAKAEARAAAQAEAESKALTKSAAPTDDPYLPEAPATVSLEGGYYLDLTEAPRSDEPQTNVGSLNSLDLRQPAPLVDPNERSIPAPVAAAPAAPDTPQPEPQQQTPPPSASGDAGLSFDDWLAGVEAIEE